MAQIVGNSDAASVINILLNSNDPGTITSLSLYHVAFRDRQCMGSVIRAIYI